jgi:hypothetical protein
VNSRVLVGVVFLAELPVGRLDLPLGGLLIETEDLGWLGVRERNDLGESKRGVSQSHLVVVLGAKRNLCQCQKRQQNGLE